ncbi:MAG: acyl-homoserine-lactone synthase [Rhizobiaceae bacterium]
MILLVQAYNYERHTNLLKQMYRLRKRVFSDQLAWDVPVHGDMEKDGYDEMKPAYLLWCNEDMDVLYGAIRLLPTTGPTLLYDVFRRTFPENIDLRAPGIWEGTRMCIDETRIADDHPEIAPGDAFCMLLLALCEVALAHGIHTLISNYEPHLKRIYKKSGAKLDEIGRAEGYGKRPVCCGVFEVSEEIRDTMREKLDIKSPLYTASRPKPKHRYVAPVTENVGVAALFH